MGRVPDTEVPPPAWPRRRRPPAPPGRRGPRAPGLATLACALWLAGTARAEDALTLEVAALIAYEEARIAAQVVSPPDEPRPPAAERRERIEWQQQALNELYARYGTDAKTYARFVARLDPDRLAQLGGFVEQLHDQAGAGGPPAAPSPAGAATPPPPAAEPASPARPGETGPESAEDTAAPEPSGAPPPP